MTKSHWANPWPPTKNRLLSSCRQRVTGTYTSLSAIHTLMHVRKHVQTEHINHLRISVFRKTSDSFVIRVRRASFIFTVQIS